MSGVQLHDVRKTYGAVPVLHGISLDIRDGQFVVLVGPSGCGKSTLLRMIAGLEDISSGTVSIGERLVNDLPPKDRDIAMVFQNYALYPHMSVGDNMSFALKLQGMPKPEREAKVRRAADILGLGDLLDRYPRHLSGGQRQRVAMGRAIVRDPKVFLFDEPLSNLDAKLRVAMRTEIKELHQKLRTTMIYVTHDQIEAMTMADQIVVLHGGRIEQVGKPLELYDRPSNLFVASFIGSPSMNILDGTLTSSPVPSVGVGPNVTIPIGAVPVGYGGTAVKVGFRPEHIALDPAGMPAEVVVVEPTGAESQVVLRAGGHEIIAVFRERIETEPGDTLNIRIDPSKVHVFDAKDGRRVSV
jgi:multiple sugar transport system ATP-binding protein